MNIEELGNIIIGAAIRVHKVLGPGLLESAYQKCLDYELRSTGCNAKGYPDNRSVLSASDSSRLPPAYLFPPSARLARAFVSIILVVSSFIPM